MDIVSNFKAYLETNKNKPSKITIKNYTSDVRKFVQWYEKTYTSPFIASQFTTEVLQAFQQEMEKTVEGSTPAARSAKRYISSLRKFCRFLSDSGAIKANPFDAIVPPKAPEDPWEIKTFKNFLFAQHVSKLTIKNYILDVQQFFAWLEKVSDVDEKGNFLTIDQKTLEQYKERMLHDANFSATSVNRKLSSLRRYMRWLHERGLIKAEEIIEEVPVEAEEAVAVAPVPEEVPLPLTALHQLETEDEEKKDEAQYSKFAPIRLAQKSKKLVTLGASALIINPITKAAEAIHYAIWKNSERNIFAPVKTILDASSNVPTPEAVAAPVVASTLPDLTAKMASTVGRFVRVKTEVKPYSIRNISKSFYAPLEISLNEFTWWQKVIHHLRYTRPLWYKRYHRYPIAHHAHFAILIFATAIAGFATFQVATDNPRSNLPVFAASPAPPRTVAFQGRLLDKTNTPITAETNLRFGVYKSPSATGSALLWQEVQSVTPNDNGNFSVVLGRKNSLSQDIFNNNQNLYVGVTVGTNEELTPRQHFPTTGYASNSQTLQGLKPITDDANQTQNVVLALDSVGDLTIGGTASPKFQATGGQFTLSGQTLSLTTNPGSNGNVELSPDGSGIIDMQRPIQNTTNYSNISGIPGAVEVDDMLAVIGSSASQSALTVKQNSSGDIISAYSGDVAKFKVDGTGKGTFGGNLQVNGNTITTDSTSFGIVNSNVINLSIGTSASAVSLGGFSGVTTINNSLTVRGETSLTGQLTANGGITIPSGKSLTLTDFTPGAIPFINTSNHQLTQDADRLKWDQGTNSLKVTGSLCLTSTVTACAGSTAGTIYASNATVQAADLAENYTSSEKLEAGDVVIPEGFSNSNAVIRSTNQYQPQVIGIVSTKPGFTLNSDAQTDAQHPNVYPLALQGRVPVKVSTMNGPIKAGDSLTTSSIQGVAMKATAAGPTVAKALENYEANDPNKISKIMAFVNISYQAPQSSITAGGNLSLAEAQGIQTIDNYNSNITNENNQYHATGLFGSLKAMILEVTDTIIIKGQTLKDYIASVVGDITNKEQASQSTTASLTKPASSSATLASADKTASSTATLLPTASISASLDATASASPLPYTINSATESALPNHVASDAAIPDPSEKIGSDFTSFLQNNLKSDFMDSASLSGVLTHVSNLQGDFGTFSEGLIALGPTSLTDVGVSNMLAIGNNMQLTTNSINTIGSDLNIQPLKQGTVLFMGGLVAIDTEGNLNVNGNATFAQDVRIQGKLSANIIAPIPGSDLAVNLDTKQANTPDSSFTVQGNDGKNVLKVNKKGDVVASGSGNFANISIVRGVQADTSITETHAEGSAGSGVIHAHQTARTIYTPYVSKDALVYVTATSDTQNTSLFVARQTPQDPAKGNTGSFTIQIPTAIAKDITFNWWIVN